MSIQNKDDWTLNQTWTLCLRMWKWIKEVYCTKRYRCYSIALLKKIWLNKNGFNYYRIHGGGCFFCHYSGYGCQQCPGKLVDPKFNCDNKDYHYTLKPVDFYKELLRLNRIRKERK